MRFQPMVNARNFSMKERGRERQRQLNKGFAFFSTLRQSVCHLLLCKINEQCPNWLLFHRAKKKMEKIGFYFY